MKLQDIKLEYHQKELFIDTLHKNPIYQIKAWMEDAIKENIDYPNAATISTIDEQGFPQSRIILIKDIREEGIVFFTNYESNKAHQINASDKVALNIFWKELDRQIRLTANVKKTSYQESNTYFQSRPLESQISAIASPQSKKLTKEELQKLVDQTRNSSKSFECPEHWGGYILSLNTCEIWQGRPNRLYDRFLYEKEEENSWIISRLAP